MNYGKVFTKNFLGDSPDWYKLTILAFLVVNPILLFSVGSFFTGWVVIIEFIYTLAMALKCYPLPPAGLIALETVLMGMTSPAAVYEEAHANFPVIMLLMFMVAAIYFMKEGLLFFFARLLINIRSKIVLSLLFCFAGAFLSAFLDALTVTAVIMSVAYGFYGVYHQYASSLSGDQYSIKDDGGIPEEHLDDLDQFKGFLRNLMMHAAVGTALGGATTLVGEPQNLIIGEKMKWHFADFFLHCMYVSIPVLIAGLITCFLLERFRIIGYGYQLPQNVYDVLHRHVQKDTESRDRAGKLRLIVQGVLGVILVLSLAFHLAEVGVIGLTMIILLTSLNGIVNEGEIGHAFEESLPFTALLVVFFSIVAMIHDQDLFKPIIGYVLSLKGTSQLGAYFIANGVLSSISDNVFVATVYMNETASHFSDVVPLLGHHASDLSPENFKRLEHFAKLAVSINMGTNIPSVATPNGQAAFLFLLTSALAPLIKLSYMEMVKLALPYTIVMSLTGYFATIYLLR